MENVSLSSPVYQLDVIPPVTSMGLGHSMRSRDSLGEQLLSVVLSSADPRDFRLAIRAMANAA